MIQEDKKLIIALKQGDKGAFEMLYDRYYKNIYRFVFSFIKEKEQAKDTLQDTFLTIWLNKHKLDPDQPIDPYLFTICRRKLLDKLRMITSTAAQRENLKVQMSEQSNETEENIIFKDLMAFASFVIESLPTQQKTIIKLRRLNGFSNDEIALKLNLSKHTVRNHLNAANKNLKSLLQKQGGLLILTSLFLIIK